MRGEGGKFGAFISHFPRGDRLPAAVGTVVTLLFLGWRLEAPALWADELATEGAAKLSLVQLFKLVSNIDMVLAPYYLFMHSWVAVFGSSEISLRVPSVIAMSISAGLSCDISRRIFGQKAAWITVLLFVFTPAISHYGQEARPYAAGGMFCCAAVWFLLAERSRSEEKTLKCSAAAITAMGLMQPAFLLSLPGIALLGWRELPNIRRRWITACAIAAIPGCAIYAYSASGDSSIWDWVALITPSTFQWRLASVMGTGSWVPLIPLMVALYALRFRGFPRYVAVVGVAPIFALLLAGAHWQVFIARLLFFSVPFILILAAGCLGRISCPGGLAITLLFGILSFPQQVAMREAAGHGQASRMVISTLGRWHRADDVVIYGGLPRSINWSPRDMVNYYVPEGRRPVDILAIEPQRANGRFMAVERSDVAEALGGKQRIWIVRADSPKDPRTLLPGKSPWLMAHTHVRNVWRGAYVTIAVLERNEHG